MTGTFVIAFRLKRDLAILIMMCQWLGNAVEAVRMQFHCFSHDLLDTLPLSSEQASVSIYTKVIPVVEHAEV